jgi:hypothetical protein
MKSIPMFNRAAACLTLLCLLPILWIRARPYQPDTLRDLRALLDSCHSPCFLDIRLGLTPVTDAIVLLQDHAWVEAVNEHYNQLVQRYGADELSQLSYLLSWRWSAARPAWITDQDSSMIVVENNRVTGAFLQTALPLGDALLALSDDDLRRIEHGSGISGPAWLIHDDWFPERCLWLSAGDTASARDFHRPALIYLLAGNSNSGCED